jgi:hypothetical protein
VVSSTGIPPTVVAIVGPSVGHRSGVEQFGLSETAPWRLAKRGVSLDSVVVTKISDGSVVSSADYTLTPTSSPSSNSNYYVDVALAGSSSLPDPTPVFLAFDYTDPDFYNPQSFDNFEDIRDSYGEPLNLTPPTVGQGNYHPVSSPLSLAAKVALENGASSLVLCATTPPASSATTTSQISAARKSALAAAYAKLSGNFGVNVVVPVTDQVVDGDAAGVGADLRQHVDTTSADGYFRVGILGFDPAITTAPDTLAGTGNFRSRRLVLAYAAPGGMAYYNGISNQSMALGHQYLAAAYAGRLAAVQVQKALTREVVRSFSGVVGTPLSSSTKNTYAAAGVALVETNRLLQTVCRHGVTTDISDGDAGRELSVVRSHDALVSLIDSGVETAGLIGQPVDTNTPLNIKGVVAGLLEHAQLTGVVVSYDGLQVRQQSLTPTVVEVRFSYQPPYPTNYILVSLSVNVATGETTTTNAA